LDKEGGESNKTLSVSALMSVIDSWLPYNDPVLLNDLLPPASTQELQDLTDCLGKKLPSAFCELYLCHNGQATGKKRLLGDWYFMPLEGGGQRGALEQYSSFKDIDGGISDGYVKHMKCNTLWVPFATDFDYNFLAIDLDPAQLGEPGQVICFGPDEKTRRIAGSLADYLVDVAIHLGVPQKLLEESAKKHFPHRQNISLTPGEKVNLFALSREKSLGIQDAKPALPGNVVELKPGVHEAYLDSAKQADSENAEELGKIEALATDMIRDPEILPEKMPLLLQMAVHAQPAVRERALSNIGSAFARARECRQELLDETLNKIEALAEQSLKVFHAALADADPEVRGTAAEELGRMRHDSSLPLLVKALGDRSVRIKAALALGKFGRSAESAIDAILRYMSESYAREFLCRALAEIGGLSAQNAGELSDFLNDRNPRVRCWVFAAIGTAGPAASQLAGRVLAALNDRDKRVRKEAIRTLGNIRAVEAAEQLYGILRDAAAHESRESFQADNPGRCAALSLAQMGQAGQKAVPEMIKVGAVPALAELNTPEARSGIIWLLDDKDSWVRANAIEAIEALWGGDYSAEILRKILLLRRAPGPAGKAARRFEDRLDLEKNKEVIVANLTSTNFSPEFFLLLERSETDVAAGIAEEVVQKAQTAWAREQARVLLRR
jgi:cell wall assembly regulator SMI1/HEAT repeat protein